MGTAEVGRGLQQSDGEVLRGRPLLRRRLSRLGYYGLALTLVAVGLVIRLGLERAVGPGLPTYITFYPCVIFAALIGGWGPGILATVATAALADYLLLMPPGLFKIDSVVDLVGLAFFCGVCVFMSVVAELYRRTRDRLEDLVVARTLALSQANEQLKDEVAQRTRAQEALRELNATLESRVAERTLELEQRARQLEEAWAKVHSESEARVAALEQLRHEDRLKTVGRLASGIAHEVGTPLNVISGYAAMIAGGSLSAQDVAEGARTIKGQSERIANLVRQILGFARRRPSQRIAVNLRQLASQTLGLMTPLAQKQKVRLILADGGDAGVVRVDVEQIRQVLLNLVTNAVQAMPRGGTVEVAVGPARGRLPARQTDAGQYACISVLDEGEGIPEENLAHIFEPFFTTKGPGKGTGLGLAIADGIVREHGGWITVESTAGKGSRFCVCLPKEDKTCPSES
jgi:signal transduction histidine kinase